MKSKNTLKKILALLMVLALCMGLLPAGALAAGQTTAMQFSYSGVNYTMLAGSTGSGDGVSWSCDADGNFSMEFAKSGTLSITKGKTKDCTVVVVGGGAGGTSAYGSNNNGNGGNGGGAGQKIMQSITVPVAQSITVKVGAGGVGGTGTEANWQPTWDKHIGGAGGDSQFSTVIAVGGRPDAGGAGGSHVNSGSAGADRDGGGGASIDTWFETDCGNFRPGNTSCFVCGVNDGYFDYNIGGWTPLYQNASDPGEKYGGTATNGGGAGGRPQNDHNCRGSRTGLNAQDGTGGGGGGGAFAMRLYGIGRYDASPTGSANPRVFTGNGGNGGSGKVTLTGKVDLVVNITLTKTSANPEMTNGNSCYSLAGAQYGIYTDAACTNLVKTITTGEDGIAKSGDLEPLDYYYVREISPSQGYLLDSRTYTLSTNGGGDVTLAVKEQPGNDPIGISVTKITDDPAATLPSLAGTQFTVKFYGGQYNSVSELPATPLRTWVIETKPYTTSTGKTIYRVELTDEYKLSGDEFYYSAEGLVITPIGTITVQETKPADGYTTIGGWVNSASGDNLASSDGIVILNVTPDPDSPSGASISHNGALKYGNEYTKVDKPVYGGVKVQKLDAETGEAIPQGAGSFAGIAFEVVSLNEADITVGGTVYSNGDVVYSGKSDDNGLFETSADLLPAGHYRLDEKTAPEGYLLLGQTSVEFDVIEDGVLADMSGMGSGIFDRPVRADFSLLKQNGETKEPMSGVKFRITSNTTGESYEFVTDDKGTFNSAGSDLRFGAAGEGGALLYDTYTVQELPCEANKGYTLAEPVVFEADGSATAIKIVGVYNYQMRLSTSATFADGEKYALAQGTVKVRDEVTYENLQSLIGYTLVGKLWDGEGFLRNAEGEEITESLDFTAVAHSGVKHMDFEFNADGMEGKSVTVYEYLYKNGESEPIIVHADSSDEAQTVHFPALHTQLRDDASGLQLTAMGDEVTATDHVYIDNAGLDGNCVLKGWLMDAATGEIALDSEGNEIRAEVNLNQKATDAAVSLKGHASETDTDKVFGVPFTFKGNFDAGKVFVAYEEFYRNGKLLAVHKDINDPEQAIGLPKLHTEAVVTDTGLKVAPAGQKINITDTIKVEAWNSNLPLSMYGRVVLESDPDRVLAECVSKQWLKSSSSSDLSRRTSSAASFVKGELKMDFAVDTTGLEGETLVVQEYIRYGDYVLATHADLHDEKQSIHIPKIGTSAKDKDTGLELSLMSDKITIGDTVGYENLIPGDEITVKGTLMDKATGKPALDADGNKITAEAVFTPTMEDGEALVSFTFNGEFEVGKVFVAFEELYYKDVLLAVHTDLEDDEQTVYVPKIKTSAMSLLTGDHMGTAGELTVRDTIGYEQLKPGLEYAAYSTVVDAEKPDAILCKATTAFTPEAESGEVSVDMSVNAEDYKGKTIVVLEVIMCEGKIVAVHQDADDPAQSILIPMIGTSAKDKETGAHWAIADGEVTITDAVSYCNLIPGGEFSLSSKLMLAPDGTKVIAAAEKAFVPDKANGIVNIDLDFDGSALAGQKVVVFEELRYNGVTVATHMDMNDKEQTVVFPAIHTSLTVDGEKKVPERGKVTPADEVSYTNLIPGQEYTLQCRLVDSGALGEPENIPTVKDADGKELTAELKFTPKTENGKVTMSFEFNAIGMKGRTLVAFERLYLGDDTEAQPVAVHEDIRSAEQSVSFVSGTSPDAVKTGDESHAMFWLALMTAASVGICAVGITVRKRKEEI